MTFKGVNSLSVNERIVVFLTGVVSFISILATVWYAAISVNDLTHEISQASANITKMGKVVSDTANEYKRPKYPSPSRRQGICYLSEQ